jgi:hypothetical protein
MSWPTPAQFPAELATFAAGFATHANAAAAATRADWRIWLAAADARDEQQRRAVISKAVLAAQVAGLARSSAAHHLFRPRDSAVDIIARWSRPPQFKHHEDGRPELLNGVVLAMALGFAVTGVGWRLGWNGQNVGLLATAATSASFPLFQRGWRALRRAVNRGRVEACTSDGAWDTIVPLVDAAWERASPGQRAALMHVTKPPA